MLEKFTRAFFGYGSQPSDIGDSIEAACLQLEKIEPKLRIDRWPQLDTFGSAIPDDVRIGIDASDVFLCDITHPNRNVYYEIGYAIGGAKPVGAFVNVSHLGAERDIQNDGLFDVVGYKRYENATQLATGIRDLPTSALAELYSRPLNYQQPLFLIETLRKTDFRNAIVSAIKDSKVFYRSFDPAETPRFSLVAIIGEITASAGVVIPVLNDNIDDAFRHNLRGAFTAGLAHGLQRQTLLIKHLVTDSPIPADFRNDVVQLKSPGDVKDVVSDFARSAQIAAQSISRPRKASVKNRAPLQTLALGASAAENEFRTLEYYFVETSEFLRTARGEVNIVAGRKGSGKTAIFFQARDRFREIKSNLVVDLKPESHQLSLLREELLKIADVGVLDHTLAAFWYYLVLTELLITLKRNSERKRFDSRQALAEMRELEELLEIHKIEEAGDFTNRINRLVKSIVQEINRLRKSGSEITPHLLTNIVFKGGISELKSALIARLSGLARVVLLLDNIDKGWPATGVNKFDVRLVRLLIEALAKIKRDFGAERIDFVSVVFLRNDIYELMMDETPDRGKSGQAVIDWTDRGKLRQVIYERLKNSTGDRDAGFHEQWRRFFCEHTQGRPTIEYFIDHCLMRPRFLINIIEGAVANAINRGNQRVEQQDCIDAVKQHSLYLVSDFGYEIRDVSGLSHDLLYAFVGVTEHLTQEEIQNCLIEAGVDVAKLEQAIDLLLWYGVLGVAARDGEARFIYDYDYNFKRLIAEKRSTGPEPLYVVNRALHVALNG